MNDLASAGFLTDGENWSSTAPASRERDYAELLASGLIDADWYRAAYADPDGIDPVAHFLTHGAREGRMPNLYFDTAWYQENNPHARMLGQNPLLHYLRRGEAELRAPAPYFDLAWYRTRHSAAPGQSLLRHFLDRRTDPAVSPLPEFDPAFYYASYPDIASAGVDPFAHYLQTGYKEGRNPSASFDTRFYQRRYLDGDLSENPLLHYRRVRRLLHVHPMPPHSETGVFEAVRRNTRPGPDFETFEKLPQGARRRAKVLAYYLPQFHAVPENDEWWGTGFTEWTSIARGMPRFEGHYQPRVPRDLGHYTLDTTETMRRQVAMARDAGLFGFVHYFYWFNGRRLLERPIEAMLEDAAVDFPFCLMWANENWTRRWDGSDQEVLISQDYRAGDDVALVDCLARHFRDPRYIRLPAQPAADASSGWPARGRPLLMVYRPSLIPDTAATVARWRRLFRDRHGEDPLLVMAQSFAHHDPRPFGFDAAIEFPPHKLVAGAPLRNAEMTYFDPRASAQVYAYDDIAAASLAEPTPAYPLIKTAVPSWDNDARRQGAGMVLHGASPAKYQAWLAALVARAAANPVAGTPLVCVNAWNEWAEAAYLEPDVHYGSAYLNATARAVTGMAADAASPGLLLVGHDAFAAGAQMLLLHLARRIRGATGLRVEVLLLGDGALRSQYAAVAPTTVLGDAAQWPAFFAGCAARGITAALVNTSVAGVVVPHLAAAGIPATLLVHELPRLIERMGALPAARAGAQARRVVFAAAAVQEGFATLAPLDRAAACILPQGNYRAVTFCADARARLRDELGLADGVTLVLGAGYADLRKGFDLFLQSWRAFSRRQRDAVFAWIGDIDPTLAAHLGPEIAAAEATGRFLRPGFCDDTTAWFSAADVFCLSSREDPFPTVVLEALSSGLKVAAFAGSGGIPDLLDASRGGVAPMGDSTAMAGTLARLVPAAHNRRARCGQALAAQVAFDFGQYTDALLAIALPELARISVIVPSYNYAHHLPARLGSIFSQSHPVVEVLVLDDASKDDSVAMAQAVAAQWQREITLVENATNSGQVFAQWRRGVELAKGDYVWIAEADDEADPGLLASLAATLDTGADVALAACDSRAVDAEGAVLWPSYQPYFAGSGASSLAFSGLFDARDFAARFLTERNLLVNVSAILFRRTSLLAALERCAAALPHYRVAGDWHLYLDLLAGCTGQVAWVAAPLNSHRRHDASVTGALDPARHVAEIARAHAHAGALLGSTPELQQRQHAYLDEVAAAMGVPAPAPAPAPPRRAARGRPGPAPRHIAQGALPGFSGAAAQ